MKIIIDILTPKQCMLFQKLSERLEREGHDVFMFTRRYREVNQLLDKRGMNATVIGKHGGKDLRDKLVASAERILKFTPFFKEINPDISLSFASPELARVSYGLGVPHLCISDSPHAVAVSRLTIPLSSRLFTPAAIPKEAWTKYGISAGDITQYNSLDPWAWLHDFKPDESIIDELGLDITKPVITVRVPESYAAYLWNSDSKESSIIWFMNNLKKLQSDLQIVVLPRYEEQINKLRDASVEDVIICDSVVDGASLLYYTDVFVGAGGTMSAEAVLLGVPTFSSYPGDPYLIEQYLIKRGLVVRENNYENLFEMITSLLDDLACEREKQAKKTKELVRDFEDPIDVIVNGFEEFNTGRKKRIR